MLAACGERVEKKSRNIEGQSQALSTPRTSSPGNADAEGSKKADNGTSADLTLQPSNPAAQESGGAPVNGNTAPAGGTGATSATQSNAATTTQSAEALVAPADSASPSGEKAALGGSSDTTSTGAAGGMAAGAAAAGPIDFAQSPSPYLRAASKSEIKWQPFAAATFASAQQQNKPVIIDIGANWNHQCRQMAAEAYADANVVQALNDKFVCVKVDADLQPDVAQRYRAAYQLINSRDTEYPLTVFALPDGRPFDVLSYVPATAQGDQAGMAELIKQVQDLFTGQSAQVKKQAELIESKLTKQSMAAATAGAALDPQLAKQAAAAVAKVNDATGASAGTVAAAMLQLYSDGGDKAALENASKLLLDQFRSPLRDQVLGGYFHTSVADKTPRFEKLLPVQATLLSANALAFAAGRKAMHKEAAEEILRFCRDTLEAQGGGFYASQDADAGPNDNASYFTWSKDEIFKLAGEDTPAKVFAQYLNAGAEKGPLFVTQKLQSAADANGASYELALKALKDVRAKLREARMQQENVPNVNKAIFASWNSEGIMAYLDTYKYLGDVAAREFALQTADFIINNMVDPRQGVAHVFYKGHASEYGLLDDNAKFAAALMQCFEVSGQREYLESAESIMAYLEKRFLDKQCGLYADRLPGSPDVAGLQKVPMCMTVDHGATSGNSAAAQAWYALYQATTKEEYREKAERLVQAALSRDTGTAIENASLARTALLVANGAPKVLIIAKPDDAAAKQMHEAALPVFRMGKLVEMMTPEDAAKTDYPPAKDGSAIAYVCTAKNCAPPVRDAGKVAELVKTFGKAQPAKEPATEVAAPAGEPDSAPATPPKAEKQTM
jgi:uncharacterized protein YyaL (SSP411 family)